MKLERIAPQLLLDAMRRNGTRETKVKEVEAMLDGTTRWGYDDKFTVVMSGGHVGVAARTRYAGRADEPDTDRGMSIAACGLLA